MDMLYENLLKQRFFQFLTLFLLLQSNLNYWYANFFLTFPQLDKNFHKSLQ